MTLRFTDTDNRYNPINYSLSHSVGLQII